MGSKREDRFIFGIGDFELLFTLFSLGFDGAKGYSVQKNFFRSVFASFGNQQ